MSSNIIKRFAITITLGILIAIFINESSFIFLKSSAGRGPQRVELVIPAGTAERIRQGAPIPSIPTNMVFVAGDTLTVTNQDNVDHKLGPLFIPAGTSASLTLNEANNYVYECSFQTSRVFGLDVQEPVTSATRIYGILIAGIPLGLMFAFYSLVIWPIKKVQPVAQP